VDESQGRLGEGLQSNPVATWTAENLDGGGGVIGDGGSRGR
jgi:hypothetical protein